MTPHLVLIFIFGAALLILWLVQMVANYRSRHYCRHCGSKAPRTIRLIKNNISDDSGYHGNEYQSTCPQCGDSYKYVGDLWLYEN